MIVAEAPGKVLVTGGYLVLDRAYTGVVLATDARFRVTVASPSPPAVADVAVVAPQFGWRQQYRLVRRSDGGVGVVATEPVYAPPGLSPGRLVLTGG
jgi:hypothetical protein